MSGLISPHQNDIDRGECTSLHDACMENANWCFHIPQDKEETATSGGAGAGASTDGPSDEENLQMLDTMMQDPNIQVGSSFTLASPFK